MARVMARASLCISDAERGELASEARVRGQDLSDYVREILEGRREAVAPLLDGLAGRLEDRLETLVQAVTRLTGEPEPVRGAEPARSRLSIRLPQDLLRRLEKEAAAGGRTLSGHLRHVILARPRTPEPIEARLAAIDAKLGLLAQGVGRLMRNGQA